MRSLGKGKGLGFWSKPAHSAAVRDYFSRLGASRVGIYDKANAYLIDALKEQGGAYWDTAGTITTLCAKAWGGLLVPLRDGMDSGTNSGIPEGNYNAATGLKGSGSHFINSNRNNNADGQNDQSMGVWSTEPEYATEAAHIGAGTNDVGASSIYQSANPTLFQFRSRASSVNSVTNSGEWMGYAGMSRSLSTGFDITVGSVMESLTRTSEAPLDGDILVFARGTSASPSSISTARNSIYHVGPSIDLEIMDTILTEFMARVAAA